MKAKSLPTRDVWSYASGEGISSITINGMGNYAMLFFAQIMGMDLKTAGLALGLATFWDAISDPLMGTITDRTNSRFGRRHPYMFIGGLLLSVIVVAVWFIPEFFQEDKLLFLYVLGVNIAMKTAFTIFVVPYTALGFEMCKSDNDQARLQGFRYSFNMLINILVGGFGWVLFFPDQLQADGTMLDGTKVHGNYLNLGVVLGALTFIIALVCTVATYKFASKDVVNRDGSTIRDHVKAFIHDLKDVYSDRLVWFVFGFFGLAQFAMAVVSLVQIFTYVEFMQFSAWEKTFVHTGGMIGFMLGAFFLDKLVRRIDKKKTGYLAMGIGSFGCLALWLLFSCGLMEPKSMELFKDPSGAPFYLSSIVFGLLQTLWWGGCGIIVPLATSMIGDLSIVKKFETGEVTEGRYAAGFSFCLKAAQALGLFLGGAMMTAAGYVAEADSQTADTLENLALLTFVTGPILMASAFLVLRKYPITHQFMADLRAKHGQSE